MEKKGKEENYWQTFKDKKRKKNRTIKDKTSMTKYF